MAKAKKQKLTVEAKREKIAPPKYTTDEFMRLDPEKQAAEFRKLGRRLNERMRQIERAGLQEVPGYRAAVNTIVYIDKTTPRKKGGRRSPERFPERIPTENKRQLRQLYVKMANATEYTTLLLPYAKEYAAEIGQAMTGEKFSFEDYSQMTKQQKSKYWETFNKLQAAAPNYYRDRGEGSGEALKIYNEILKKTGRSYLQEGSKNFMAALDELESAYFKYVEAHAPVYQIEIPKNRGPEFYF